MLIAFSLALMGVSPVVAGDGSQVTPQLDPGANDIPGLDIHSYGNPFWGYLDALDTDDVYGIPLEAGESISVTLDGDAGTDFDLLLYDPYATTINGADYIVEDSTALTYPDSLTYRAVLDVGRLGNHELDVARASGSGAYELSWQIIENDTLGPGGPPGAMTKLSGHLERFTDDNDFYGVVLQPGWRVVSTLVPGSADFDPELYLLGVGETDVDSRGVAQSEENPGVSERIDYTSGVPGLHYLNAFAGGWGTGGDYAMYHTVLSEAAGADRYGTCAAASQRGWTFSTSDNVVIATGQNWPDALGGSAVAGALDCPILIVRRDHIPAEVLDEIRRLEAKHAVVLGGSDVVGNEVTDALEQEGLTWERLGGESRYETAELAAAYAADVDFTWDQTAFVASGRNFPDALVASPVSAALSYPIFLESASGLSYDTVQTMMDIGVKKVVLLGQSAAVSDATEAQMRSTFGAGNVTRLGGPDRYATGVAIAEWALGPGVGMGPTRIAVTTGQNFPDALSGGPMVARRDGIMVLSRNTLLPAGVAGFLDTYSGECEEIVFLGESDVVGPIVRDAVADLLGRP